VLAVVALIRWRLLAVPFERDEGEYAYMGRLILGGGLPYRDAYGMKLPGTYLMYAAIMAAFGSSPTGVHAGFAVVSLATAVILYAAFGRLFSRMTALVAASLYALLSVGESVLGSAAHATHFVNLFVALGLLALPRRDDGRPARRSALAGLMFGLAILMKQPAVVLALAGAAAVAGSAWAAGGWRRATWSLAGFAAGAALPYAAVAAVMAAGGGFDRFWFWTATYAARYASASTPWVGLKALFALSFRPIVAECPAAWLLAGAGAAMVWLTPYGRRERMLAFGLALASAAAVVPGLNFRPHYFVVALPAVGLLAAIALEFLAGALPSAQRRPAVRWIPWFAVAAMAVVTVAGNRAYYLEATPEEVCGRLFAGNPFVEAREVGASIAGDSAADDTVGVIGSEPEILVYANRRSATRYLYVYPLVERQPLNAAMQREMMAEIEAARPKYLVYCNVPFSWAAGPDSPRDILEWFNRYAPRHYELVGMAALGGDGTPSAYYRDAEARAQGPRPNSLWVLRRRQ
jgi:hypothetical protein